MLLDRLQNLARYLLAAPLPHLSALTAGSLAWALVRLARAALLAEEWAQGLACTMAACPFALGALLAEADALARFHEYRRVKGLFLRYGARRRLFGPMSGSRCQRDAMRLAATEAGCQSELTDYLRERGFRWYHLAPAHLTADPLYFLDWTFWRTTFWPKTNRV